MVTEQVTIYNELNDSYGSPYGLGYRGYIFVFDTIEERDAWVEECTDEDLDYIIDQEESSTEV